ncbi:nephrocystin-3-like isoform X1 [Corticium candelabrum]|uniref:nephrocystin-3-like isoform X1 n=1 Tax=Corticium candelabrum TaxID=121492 RepID=UPI002E2557B3|nr:nephrocystin-3-like isoform X1 [Corticium candelabrum]
MCSCLPRHHPDIGTVLWNLGVAYRELNNIEKATVVWRECLAIRERAFSPTHPCVIDVLKSLGRIAYDQQLYDESLQLYGKLQDILMRTSPVSEDMATGIDNRINVLINNITILLLLCLVCHNMGACYFKLSQLDAAEKALSQSLQLKTSLYSPGHYTISITETQLHQLWQLKYGR